MCRGRRPRGEGRPDPVRALTGVARVAGLLPLPLLGLAGAQEPAVEVRAGPVVVRSAPGHEAVARRALEAVRAFRFPGIPEDAWTQDSLVVLLAPDLATFRTWARGVPDWGAGAAFPEAGVVVVPLRSPSAGPADWRPVLHHEIAHVALWRAVRARIPPWFDEGYAQWASGAWDAESAWQLRIAFLLGRTPPLDSLTLEASSRAGQARWAYLLSYTAVQYLHELSGPHAFARFLERWRAHGSLDAALRETYGLTLAGFERLWRAHVKARYGWLLVASQATTLWLAFTLLLLGLGVWVRHRRRLQYAEMARRERESPESEKGEPGPGPGTEPRVGPPAGPEEGAPGPHTGDRAPSGDPRDRKAPPTP